MNVNEDREREEVPEEPKARRTPWKQVCCATLALLILAGIVSFLVSSRSKAERKWAELEKRFHEKVAEAGARTYERPVLHGEALPGKAWDHYEKALKLIPKEVPGVGDFWRFVEYGDLSYREAARNAVERYPGLSDHIRRGAAASDGGKLHIFHEDAEQCRSLLRCQNITFLVNLDAAERFLQGNRDDAVRLNLDVLQFSSDLARGGALIDAMISYACVINSVELPRRWVEESVLGGAEMGVLAEGLAKLDSSLPDCRRIMSNELVEAHSLLLEQKRTGVWADDGVTARLDSFVYTWGYGLCFSLLVAEAAEEYGQFLEDVRPLYSLPWSEFERRYSGMSEEVETSGSPLTPHLVGNGSLMLIKCGRLVSARLRILQAALMIRRAGDFPEGVPQGWPDDPFSGTPLRYRRSPEGTVCEIWSVGPDGADNNGSGSWRGPDKGADLVLKLERHPEPKEPREAVRPRPVRRTPPRRPAARPK